MTKLPKDAPLPTPLEAELLAVRAVSALVKMPAEDRTEVLGTVPQDVHGAAALVVGDIREEAPELHPRVEVLEQRIEEAIGENDDRSHLDDAFRSGREALAVLLDAAAQDTAWPEKVRAAAPRLKEVFAKANLSAAELEGLVQELELLQDLHGTRDLAQVNDAAVRRAIETLHAIDLASLVRKAGADLGHVLFKELSQTAKDEGAV